MRVIFRFFIMLTLLLPLVALGKSASTDPAVDVGIYINRINSLSYKEGTFNVDMTVWFRWKNSEIHPDKTFALKGATINARRDEYSGVVSGTDLHWAGIDLVATVHNAFNVRQFPFDSQKLLIQIEEIEQGADVIQYRLDADNVKLNKNLEISGWKVVGDQANVTERKYETNFGYVGRGGDQGFTSSQLNYEIQLERTSPMAGVKLIIAPVVAILILLLTSLLPTTQSARFGVGTTVIFALVSSHYLVLTQIPETNYVTIAEQIVIFGLLQSLVYFIVNVYAFNAQDRGDATLHRKLDKILASFLGATDVIFTGYLFTAIL